jgi:hypothetical protein
MQIPRYKDQSVNEAAGIEDCNSVLEKSRKLHVSYHIVTLRSSPQ